MTSPTSPSGLLAPRLLRDAALHPAPARALRAPPPDLCRMETRRSATTRGPLSGTRSTCSTMRRLCPTTLAPWAFSGKEARRCWWKRWPTMFFRRALNSGSDAMTRHTNSSPIWRPTRGSLVETTRRPATWDNDSFPPPRQALKPHLCTEVPSPAWREWLESTLEMANPPLHPAGPELPQPQGRPRTR